MKVKRLWAARHRYAHRRDWLLSFYQRVLARYPHLARPGRGRVRWVRLAGMSAPFAVRFGTSDWYVLEDIFLAGEYEPLMQRELQSIHRILDLGANAGFSVRLWQRLYPQAAIIAVEPDAANLRMCRRNALRGKKYGPLRFVQTCVAGHSRLVTLNRAGGEWEYKLQEFDGAEAAIQALTVPQLLADVGGVPLDLLKCDIEGAEAEVFADCHAWIGRVRHLVVELHAPYRAAQFLADLQRNGGQFQVYEHQERAETEVLFLEQKL